MDLHPRRGIDSRSRGCLLLRHSFVCRYHLLLHGTANFTFLSFPEQAKWLRQDEKAYIAARLQIDVGLSSHVR